MYGCTLPERLSSHKFKVFVRLGSCYTENKACDRCPAWLHHICGSMTVTFAPLQFQGSSRDFCFCRRRCHFKTLNRHELRRKMLTPTFTMGHWRPTWHSATLPLACSAVQIYTFSIFKWSLSVEPCRQDQQSHTTLSSLNTDFWASAHSSKHAVNPAFQNTESKGRGAHACFSGEPGSPVAWMHHLEVVLEEKVINTTVPTNSVNLPVD